MLATSTTRPAAIAFALGESAPSCRTRALAPLPRHLKLFNSSLFGTSIKTPSGPRVSSTARTCQRRISAVASPMARPKSGGRESNMEGKVVIVTGANTGMGLETAKGLVDKGAHVIMACRSQQKGAAALAQVQLLKGAKGSAELASLDLASLASVRQFADEINSKNGRLDVLINNAGIMVPPYGLTKDGYEQQWQVNHLSHYLLTRLLLPKLLAKKSGPNSEDLPLLINISSLAGERASLKSGDFWKIAQVKEADYSAWTAYRHSKLAQVMFSNELDRRYGDQLTANSLHPGIVATELFNRNMSSIQKTLLGPVSWVSTKLNLLYTPKKGASTALYLATAPREVVKGGGYYADSAQKKANPLALDPALAKECWDESAKMVGLEP